MADDFASHETSLMSPAQDASAITPSDSVALPRATRGFYVGGADDFRRGDTFTGVLAGAYYPLRVAQVMATGTTATALIGLR